MTKKRKIEDVVEDIINLGKRLKWFVPLIKNNPITNYIYNEGNKYIYIDTEIFKLFNQSRSAITHSSEELKNYLLEILYKVVEDSNKYSILFDDDLISSEDDLP